MEKILELSRQIIQGLDNLLNGITSLRANIVEAGNSHVKQANAETSVDTAEKWNAIQSSNSFNKGVKTGYANACSDFLGLIDNLANSVASERASLEELFAELFSVAEEPETVGEDDVPLV